MPEDVAAVAGLPAGQPGEILSCVTCRSRKLRCDKTKPICARCAKSEADCIYPEARRKPTFKRRNVKELEERLAQVEELLRQANEGRPVTGGIGTSTGLDSGADVGVGAEEFPTEVVQSINFEIPTTEDVLFEGFGYGTPNFVSGDPAFAFNQENPTGFLENNHSASTQPVDDFASNPFHGELIDLGGVFESLPPFEVMEDLNRLFFERQQQFAPMVHPGRYLQAFYSAPHMKPPMCLQYAMWALTSNNDPKYHGYHDIFYRRARQYADFDEMKGHGEHFITVAHAQAWCILATDEARSTMFTRAAMSAARAVRLAAMMGLHHLDSPPDESSPTLVPPRDWVELEERRRVFWGIFSIDSHCSISTGWPHLIDVDEVTTHLPASEAAFQSGQPMETCSIHDVFKGGHSYSSFAGSVVVCHLFNQILKHAHRTKANDNPEDLEYGAYWKRHRDLDNTLSSAFMFLPESFRLPEHYRELTAVNMNLNLHAAIICLHHAALERIETNNLPVSIKKISQDRLGAAAQEIINILKLTSHLSSNPKTPLAAVSLFCAASVYIYFCQENQTPTHVDNLDFILSAMEAIGRTHSMTRSFLRQAVLDAERNGILDMVRVPTAERLLDKLNHAVEHNVPLLARTRLSRHSEAQPPLPGLLTSRSLSYNTPYRYDTWRNPPSRNPFAALASLGGSSSSTSRGSSSMDGHIHKRKRTTTPSASTDSSSPQNESDVPTQQPSISFNYLPIRSDSRTASSSCIYSSASVGNSTAVATVPSPYTSSNDCESCCSNNNFHQQDSTIQPEFLNNNNNINNGPQQFANTSSNVTSSTTTTGLIRDPQAHTHSLNSQRQIQQNTGTANANGALWDHIAGLCSNSIATTSQARHNNHNYNGPASSSNNNNINATATSNHNLSRNNRSAAAAAVMVDVTDGDTPYQFLDLDMNLGMNLALDPGHVNVDNIDCWDAAAAAVINAGGGLNRFADTGGG